jgi:hypothetical protein
MFMYSVQIVAEYHIALSKVFLFFQQCSLSVKYSTLETIIECMWFDTRRSRFHRVFVSGVGDTECFWAFTECQGTQRL